MVVGYRTILTRDQYGRPVYRQVPIYQNVYQEPPQQQFPPQQPQRIPYIIQPQFQQPQPINIPIRFQQPPAQPQPRPEPVQQEPPKPPEVIQPTMKEVEFPVRVPKIETYPVKIPMPQYEQPPAPPAPPTPPEPQKAVPAKIVQDMEVDPNATPVEVHVKGYKIPKKAEPKLADLQRAGKVDKTKRLVYPLIPKKPKEREPILAYAKIFWDNKKNGYVYEVVEPKMTQRISEMITKIKELLEEKLDVDFAKLKTIEAKEYLRSEVDKLIEYYKFVLTPSERIIMQYYIEKDFMGLGRIEPIMHDSQIEDISCDGVNIPIFVFHRDPKLGSIQTNIVYKNGDELDSFITKMSQLAGKSISVTSPLLDGALPDGSRLQATLATDIARKGSNFTIRKFSDKPLTPIHLLNYKTVNIQTMAYLWMAIDYGRSLLVSGGTASGKTSILNALSIFIRPDKKIISIEDTAELRLPHPHWVPSVARTTVGAEDKGDQVDMFALLKESLRQRPDYIIVGEVRGKEAFVLFQQMATGHPSYSTIHAEDMDKLVNRLTTAPISLPKTLVGSLDLVVFMMRVKYRDRFVRRIKSVTEMLDFPSEQAYPNVNEVFKWNPMNDVIEVANESVLLKKITNVTGLDENEVVQEITRRMAILKWMQDKKITEYKDVYKVINMYYNYPQRLLTQILPTQQQNLAKNVPLHPQPPQTQNSQPTQPAPPSTDQTASGV